MRHIKGVNNVTGDFASRNPQKCDEAHCQFCKFVADECTAVVRIITVDDVLSGFVKMPFLDHTAWQSAQTECSALRRTFAHLTQGTRPARKSRNLKDLRRYLQIASIDDKGLLIVKKVDSFGVQRKLIIVPTEIMPGILTALHFHLGHPTKCQLEKVFNRYFYGLKSAIVIANVTESCISCNSLKKINPELLQQSSTPSPSYPGDMFTADVMRRAGQKILITRDVFSSFTTGIIIEDEKHTSFRSGLITTTELLRRQKCKIHVDDPSGFKKLEDDKELLDVGISLDFGRVKNKNKNAVADKCIQELQEELRKIDVTGSTISNQTLNVALSTLNKRIRNRGL